MSRGIFKGTVSEMGRYAEFATQKDVSKGRQDIKTFKIKITVPDSGGFLKPGMTVQVIKLLRNFIERGFAALKKEIPILSS
jgi:hypothetical protein